MGFLPNLRIKSPIEVMKRKLHYKFRYMYTYYILKNKKVIPTNDVIEWTKFMENHKERIIKQTTLSNGKWVSTVFLGVDYNFSPKGKPILFETMVFPKKGNYQELYLDRYHTYKEAVLGHKKAVDMYENKFLKFIKSLINKILL